ncbi:MAG TPA: flagellar motor switch protein FliM [Sphingomonas sp.]|nr:flagellar motor switch protein FliM [Sphingomonas sp.]
MTDNFGFDLPDVSSTTIGDDQALDQADIDALFGDAAAPPPPKSGLRAVIESDVINRERLPMLEVVCDRMIRSFATNMRNLTSDAIEVSLEETNTVRFGEFMNRVPLPAMFGVFRIQEWENFGIVAVDAPLIYSVVDALLGGRGGNHGLARFEGRGFTTIETSLVTRMVELALSDFATSFEPIAPIAIKLERIETSPRFAAIASPSNVTAVSTFRVEMEGRGGRLSFLLPYATLEPVRDKLLQRFMGEKLGRDVIWETHMRSEIQRTEISLEAVLAERMLPLCDVHSLELGQTLSLNRHADSPIEITSGGVRLGRAQLGQRNNNIALRLIGDLSKD